MPGEAASVLEAPPLGLFPKNLRIAALNDG